MEQFPVTGALHSTRKSSPHKKAGYPWLLLIFSAVIFGFVFIIYLGLSVGYIPTLQSDIEGVEASLAQLDQRVDSETSQKFIEFYSQFANIQELLKSHVEIDSALSFLEGVTNKQIQYTSISVDVPRSEIKLDGVAGSYGRLAEQLESLRRSSKVNQVLLTSSGNGEAGRVNFSLSVGVNSTIYK